MKNATATMRRVLLPVVKAWRGPSAGSLFIALLLTEPFSPRHEGTLPAVQKETKPGPNQGCRCSCSCN